MAAAQQVAMSGLGLKTQVAVGDGSVTVPSIGFSNDANTGIYRPSADVVGVVTGGVERMRVDAAGNVGIGTNAPISESHLHIHESSASSWVQYLQHSGTTINTNRGGMFIKLSSINSPSASIKYIQCQSGDNTNRFEVQGDGGIVTTGEIQCGQTSVNNAVNVYANKFGGLTVLNGGNLGYNITTNTDAGGWRWRFVDGTAQNPGADYFIVYYNSGNYYHRGSATSDRRIKANIVSIDAADALAKIEGLNPVTYHSKETDGSVDTSRRKGGFIAQEVAEVIPELVHHDRKLEETLKDTDYKPAYALDYNGVLAYAVAAIQALTRECQELRARVQALEAEKDP